MDPDENHARQIELALKIRRDMGAGNVDDSVVAEAADELAELVIALNDWMGNGGFPPQKFERRPSR